jgi:hypothetical protein
MNSFETTPRMKAREQQTAYLANHDERGGPGFASERKLLIGGGLAGVAAGLAYFGAQVIPWDHDLPVELARWEIVLGFWTILAVAPFAIVFAYALSRLIASEHDGALNQLGFVFAVVAFSVLAVTQSFQNAVPVVLTDEMQAEGSGPEAWDRIYAGLNALDLGTDLAWDLFLGLWLLCIGVAMFGHSRLGARWAIPALALIPPFFAFNVAATPDPPRVDLGPVIGMYFTALSVWLVWLGTRDGEHERPRDELLAEPTAAMPVDASGGKAPSMQTKAGSR